MRNAPNPDGPVRLLHVVNGLLLAGMEYGVVKQVNRLDRSRFSPMIACLTGQSEWTRPLLDPSIPVFVLGKGMGRDYGVIPKFADLLRRERVDILHSHNQQTMLYAILAGRQARTPALIHGEHGHDEVHEPRRRLLARRWLARRATHLTAVSTDLRREIVERWRIPPEKVTLIRNGVDLTRYRPTEVPAALRAELGLRPDQPVVLNVGGLRAIKDHPTLFRAFAAVRRTYPSARLLLVGTDYEGGRQQTLERLASELGITDAVRFTGLRHDLPELYALCDVYVNSSLFEGMSNTILEAMACARPVVATAVGGTPELIEDRATGLLIPASAPEALGDRLLELLREPALRTRLGSSARDWVERHRSLTGTVQAYSDLYLDTWWRCAYRRSRRASQRARSWAARGIGVVRRGRNHSNAAPPALTILMYHRVLPLPEARRYPFEGMVMPRDTFERQIAYLAARRPVLRLDEAVERLARGELPPGAVSLTFDDGYRDNFEHAWPILIRHRIPATFFVVASLLEQPGGLWWDDVAAAIRSLWSAGPAKPDSLPAFPGWFRRAAANPGAHPGATQAARLVREMNSLPRDVRREWIARLSDRMGAHRGERLLLTWEEVRAMHASGMEIGSHTASHEFLDELTEAEIRKEVTESVRAIGERIGSPAITFAYPRGRYCDAAVPILRNAGIRAAVVAREGQNGPGADPYRLLRRDAGYGQSDAGFDVHLFAAELAGWLPRRPTDAVRT